jgi:hypothetical protein
VSTASEERSVAELVRHLTEQTTTLARQEIRLAQLELQEKGRRAGIGAGAFGAAGVIGLYAAGAVIAGLIALALIAGVVALFGKRQVEAATPPAPSQAIESVKQDVDVVRERVRR